MGRPHVTGSQLALLGREPNYRRLFLATLGSGAGTWLALVALEVDIWSRTHSSGWIAALLIADMLPTFAIGILVGPLIDRLSRRRLMVSADLVRFGVFAALPFTTSAAQIVALAAVAGIATGFFRPAAYAGLPNLVKDEDLPSANALLQTVDNLTWALGSLAGGALVAASGVDAAYWINACTFLISAVFLYGIPQRLLQATAAASRGHWADLKDGFSLTVRSKALLTVLIAWNVAMFSNAAVNVAEPQLAFQRLRRGHVRARGDDGERGHRPRLRRLSRRAVDRAARPRQRLRLLARADGDRDRARGRLAERLGRRRLRRHLGRRQRRRGRLQRAARPARRARRAAGPRLRGADELERGDARPWG